MTYTTSQFRMHQFAALQPAPRLVVPGAVRGNEGFYFAQPSKRDNMGPSTQA
ncbi:MAG: hypothetical protein K9K38_10105 [Rhodoferax sp.]|nr:hypothetical protein [Rhodoferax sp.]